MPLKAPGHSGKRRLGRAGGWGLAAQLCVCGMIVCACYLVIRPDTVRLRRDHARFLYYPENWHTISTVSPPSEPPLRAREGPAMGGAPGQFAPLSLKIYEARQGDCLSEIAGLFGRSLDTISSLNREFGAGVHDVAIGEEIVIPNQDGIFAVVTEGLEALCERYEVTLEAVVRANGLDSAAVATGTAVFLPGGGHRGAELAMIEGTAFFWPTGGWISSRYAYRIDPFTNERRFHRGLDFATAAGTPIRAAQAGVVVRVREDEVFGRQITLSHLLGFTTFYAHLSRITVTPGQRVSDRTVIGYVGSTGRSTGPHLHFELRLYGAARDPERYLSRRVW